MADNIIVYAVIHQPRRPRLPVPSIAPDTPADELENYLFDDSLNRHYLEKVARLCYHPAIELFRELVEKGLRISLGVSVSFLEQAGRWDPGLLDKLKTLVANPNVDLVCVEPYHSFIFHIDIRRFQERMEWARGKLARTFGKRPVVAETTEMFMSREIYHALNRLGFKAVLMDGRSSSLGWRSATHLYNPGREALLFARHRELSDDVGYRFSQKTWHGYPLRADTYVDWIKSTEGDFVLLGWDFETFGEHHSRDTGIFEFLRWFQGELAWRGIQPLMLGEATERFRGRAYDLELPVAPSTWAGIDGTPGFFLGNSVQFQVFLLMHHAYNLARLTDDPRLIDIALWLCQSDSLHMLQWYDSKDTSEADVSSYFTPGYWWNLGASRIPAEIQRVYEQFIAVAAHRLKAETSRWKQPVFEREIAFRYFAPEAKSVELVGDFTKWHAGRMPLSLDGGGHWLAAVALRPGTYKYKFIVDGGWFADPACQAGVPDGYGKTNSVLTVR